MQKNNAILYACLLLFIALALNGCRKSEDSGCSEIFPVSVSVNCDTTAGQQVMSDAKTLVLQDYLASGTVSPDAFFPESDWKPYVRVLNAVRAAIPKIECEDLSVLLSIQPTSSVSTDELIVEVDTSFAWVDAWRNGNVLTGNPAVDSLVVKYQLALAGYSDQTLTFAALRGAEPLNMWQLGEEFSTIAGVRGVEPGAIMVDGGNIDAAREADAVVLVFSRGYWNCENGCPTGNNWRFRVDEDCNVLYEGYDPQ